MVWTKIRDRGQSQLGWRIWRVTGQGLYAVFYAVAQVCGTRVRINFGTAGNYLGETPGGHLVSSVVFLVVGRFSLLGVCVGPCVCVCCGVECCFGNDYGLTITLNQVLFEFIIYLE